MLSIARIFTARNYLRRVAIALAGVFFLFYTVISVVAAVSCKRVEGQPWYVLRYDQCIKVIKDETLSAILGYIRESSRDYHYANLTIFSRLPGRYYPHHFSAFPRQDHADATKN